MKKLITLILLSISNFIYCQQITVNLTNTNYTENFNSLSNTSSSSVLPSGWYISETGTNANTSYSVSTGSSNTGDTYSFGLSSNTDRTLGSIRSNSLNPTFGCKVTNNTGEVIESITISYSGRTWRVGASNRTDKIDFSYSLNATSLSTGTWTNFDNLDYQNVPQTTSPLSGSIIHSQSISSTIYGLALQHQSSIWFRFTDFDATGSDDGMGIDNFTIQFSEAMALPVELLHFDVEEVDGRNNFLTWSTFTEYNNLYFLIEKSTDGYNWEYLERVDGALNSNQVLSYNCTDSDIILGVNYYRLKQVDFDGKTTLYGPISINNSIQEKKIKSITNMSGVDAELNTPGVIIILYEDGTTSKKFN